MSLINKRNYYKCEQTGQCGGVYPSQGEPEDVVVMGENTILATREKLLAVFIGSIVIVWLSTVEPSSPMKCTEQSESWSPTVLARFSVIVHGGQETGTVGMRNTFVGGSSSLIRIMPSTIFSYIHKHIFSFVHSYLFIRICSFIH